MPTLIEVIFAIQFLVVISITFLKLYNVMSAGKFYDLKMSFLLFIGLVIFWGVGMVTVSIDATTITEFDELLPSSLFQIESWLLSINLIFLFVELFLAYGVRKPIDSYNALKER